MEMPGLSPGGRKMEPNRSHSVLLSMPLPVKPPQQPVLLKEDSNVADDSFLLDGGAAGKREAKSHSSAHTDVHLQLEQPCSDAAQQERDLVVLLQQMFEQQTQRLDSHCREVEECITKTVKASIASEIQKCAIEGALIRPEKSALTTDSNGKPEPVHPQPVAHRRFSHTKSDLSTGEPQSSQSFHSDLRSSPSLTSPKVVAKHSKSGDSWGVDGYKSGDSVTSKGSMVLGVLNRALSSMSNALKLLGFRSETNHKDLEMEVNQVSSNLHNVTAMASQSFRSMESSNSKSKHVATLFLSNPLAESLVFAVIISNTVYMAWETNWSAQNLQEAEDAMPEVRGVKLFFTIFFCLDLLLRIYVEGSSFISGRNLRWNLLDTFVVIIALLEEAMRHASSESAAVSSTKVVRVLRILRLIRIVRFIRGASFLAGLRAVCMGIFQSFGSLMWALALLAIVILVFSIYLTQGVAFYFMDNDYEIIHFDELMDLAVDKSAKLTFQNRLQLNFGSLLRSMYSLWKAITGGSDWQDYGDALFVIDWGLGVIFTIYIAFAVCAMLNVVIGIFANKALKIAEGDMDLKLLKDNAARKAHIKAVRSVFDKADTDDSGTLTREEFELHFENPCVQAFFRGLELDLDGISAGELFDLLDFDGDCSISHSEFIYGCSTMKGYATNLELARMHSHMTSQYENLTKALKKIHGGINSILSSDMEKLRTLSEAISNKGKPGYASAGSMLTNSDSKLSGASTQCE